MTVEEVKELLQLFNDGPTQEMDVSIDGLSLYASKHDKPSRQAVPTQKIVEETKIDIPLDQPKKNEPQTSDSVGEAVVSPIVGVVYTASSPTAAPFKQVGDTVKVGETLCIIEAMKIMNEVTSDKAGVIEKIWIENEEVVEYGQPLFTIV